MLSYFVIFLVLMGIALNFGNKFDLLPKLSLANRLTEVGLSLPSSRRLPDTLFSVCSTFR